MKVEIVTTEYDTPDKKVSGSVREVIEFYATVGTKCGIGVEGSDLFGIVPVYGGSSKPFSFFTLDQVKTIKE